MTHVAMPVKVVHVVNPELLGLHCFEMEQPSQELQDMFVDCEDTDNLLTQAKILHMCLQDYPETPLSCSAAASADCQYSLQSTWVPDCFATPPSSRASSDTATCSLSSPWSWADIEEGWEERLECPPCSRYFKSRANLVRHLRDVHGPRVWLECELCGKRLASQRSLQQHLARHVVRFFTCQDCDATFPTEGLLDMHREQYHGAANHGRAYDLCRGHYQGLEQIQEQNHDQSNDQQGQHQDLHRGYHQDHVEGQTLYQHPDQLALDQQFLDQRTLGLQALDQQTFDQQTLDQQTLGLQAFDQQALDQKPLDQQTLEALDQHTLYHQAEKQALDQQSYQQQAWDQQSFNVLGFDQGHNLDYDLGQVYHQSNDQQNYDQDPLSEVSMSSFNHHYSDASFDKSVTNRHRLVIRLVRSKDTDTWQVMQLTKLEASL